MSEEISHHRRRFLATAAMTIAAAQLVMSGSAKTRPAGATTIKPGRNTSFGTREQIDAGS